MCSATTRIVRYWRGMSYTGKTVYAAGSAASRNAQVCAGGWGCSMSKSRVSLDRPFDSGTVTPTAFAPGSRVPSQAVRRRVSSSGSRVVVRGRGAVAAMSQTPYGATDLKSANPLGSCLPNEPCSKMPWPMRPSSRKRAAWSVTPYAANGWASVRS